MKIRETMEVAFLYLGVPALTLYPLGFVALGIQMWKDPFFPYFNFSPVWNAVALVPQTIVIGTGVELLYLSLISTVLGVGVASLVLNLLPHDESGAGGRESNDRRGLWVLYLLVLFPAAALLLQTTSIDGWEDASYVAGFSLLSLGGGALIGYIRVRGRERFFLPGLAAAYVGAMLAALCLAALHSPRLPLVTLDTRVGGANACSGSHEEMFVKLSESGTHWYVYNEKGLYAIPAKEVHVARYQNCPALRIED